MSPNQPRDGAPGTTDQSPRWEGPAPNRPRGYLPAKDDPYNEEDAAGETLKHPDRRTLGDAVATKNSPPSHPAADESDRDDKDDTSAPRPSSDPAFSAEPPDSPVQRDAPAYRRPPKDTEYAGHPEFSQDAAINPPPHGIGNSEPVEDAEEKTRHSDGRNPGPAASR